MTPKEKAKELVEKYNPLVTTWDCYWDTERHKDDIVNDAKKCALIVVDEIINGNFGDGYNHQFWEEVRLELTKC